MTGTGPVRPGTLRCFVFFLQSSSTLSTDSAWRRGADTKSHVRLVGQVCHLSCLAIQKMVPSLKKKNVIPSFLSFWSFFITSVFSIVSSGPSVRVTTHLDWTISSASSSSSLFSRLAWGTGPRPHPLMSQSPFSWRGFRRSDGWLCLQRSRCFFFYLNLLHRTYLVVLRAATVPSVVHCSTKKFIYF